MMHPTSLRCMFEKSFLTIKGPLAHPRTNGRPQIRIWSCLGTGAQADLWQMMQQATNSCNELPTANATTTPTTTTEDHNSYSNKGRAFLHRRPHGIHNSQGSLTIKNCHTSRVILTNARHAPTQSTSCTRGIVGTRSYVSHRS